MRVPPIWIAVALMLPSACRVPMIVTVMLSFRSDVVPVTVLETCTVFPNVTFTSHAVVVMVSDDELRSVTVPLATALLPGDGDGAPGLGHALPNPPPLPPPPPKPDPGFPVRADWFCVVLAMTVSIL